MGTRSPFSALKLRARLCSVTRAYTRVSDTLNYTLKILQRIDPVIKLPFDLNDGKNYPPGLNTNRV